MHTLRVAGTSPVTAVREVVAVLVADGRDICLVRRSRTVDSDQGMWHCVTGYLELGIPPREQAIIELTEELGLERTEIQSLIGHAPLRLTSAGEVWTVHTYLAHTAQRDFVLNWENDEYQWIDPQNLPGDCVPWLHDVTSNIWAGRR